MKATPADASAPGPAGWRPPEERGEDRPAEPKRRAGWSRQRWLTLVALVFSAQLAFIFALGEKHFQLPRTVKDVPQLTLADSSSELIALEDPTLFVLPHARDFASVVWDQMPVVPQPSFCWMEPPGDLAIEVYRRGCLSQRRNRRWRPGHCDPDVDHADRRRTAHRRIQLGAIRIVAALSP